MGTNALSREARNFLDDYKVNLYFNHFSEDVNFVKSALLCWNGDEAAVPFLYWYDTCILEFLR